MAQYIWIFSAFSAFSEVPQNRLIFRRDLSHLKNNSRIILLIDITRDRMSVCTDYGVDTKKRERVFTTCSRLENDEKLLTSFSI